MVADLLYTRSLISYTIQYKYVCLGLVQENAKTVHPDMLKSWVIGREQAEREQLKTDLKDKGTVY